MIRINLNAIKKDIKRNWNIHSLEWLLNDSMESSFNNDAFIFHTKKNPNRPTISFDTMERISRRDQLIKHFYPKAFARQQRWDRFLWAVGRKLTKIRERDFKWKYKYIPKHQRHVIRPPTLEIGEHYNASEKLLHTTFHFIEQVHDNDHDLINHLHPEEVKELYRWWKEDYPRYFKDESPGDIFGVGGFYHHPGEEPEFDLAELLSNKDRNIKRRLFNSHVSDATVHNRDILTAEVKKRFMQALVLFQENIVQ